MTTKVSTTTESTQEPRIKVSYEWKLEDIDENQSYSSKMISFREQKIFRVGLKNVNTKPTLFFVAFNLNKMGMQVADVHNYTQGVNILKRMTNDTCEQDGNLQLFTSHLSKAVVGSCTFVFRIYIDGLAEPSYCYRLADRLVKEQLWAAAVQNQHWADVELVAKGKTFSAHKSILAARSTVFATEFATEEAGKQIRWIVMDDVHPTSVEQFLFFIYTGEPMTPMLDNKELLKLAKRYRLTNLEMLCEYALTNIDTLVMATVVSTLYSENETSFPFHIRPNKDTEIFFDSCSSNFQCRWTWVGKTSVRLGGKATYPPTAMNEYRHENLFFAHLTGAIASKRSEDYYENSISVIEKPLIHLTCAKSRNFGFKIAEVKYCIQSRWDKLDEFSINNWKMKPRSQPEAETLLFTAKSDYDLELNTTDECAFEIQLVSTIENYRYEMVDTDWTEQLWNAAFTRKLTDVDVFLGTNKVMEAHRVVLSARSPVMDAVLTKINNTGRSSICIITNNSITDPKTVQHFLQFLYTGSLNISACNEELLELAEMYEVETLKKICQLANRIPEADAFTTSLIDL